MKPRWLSHLFAPPARRPLALFVLSAVIAVATGFVLVPPGAAEPLIVNGGYYYILAVFALWLAYGLKVAWERRANAREWLGASGGVGLFLIGATLFAAWTDAFAHKVLFDEYVLQGTAWHMHLTKEIGTPIRAYDFAGTWLVIDTFLDKRPYFFSFLISLLHDLTGFRIGNVYVVNVAMALVVLGTACWLVRAITGRVAPALLTVALLATLPLFGQNATGAGMEMLNLAMIGVVMVSAILYLQAPGDDRLCLLILGAVLLAQSRYESVLFVVPVAIIVLLGWRRDGRVVLPWPAILAPLLLVPYAWHGRFVSAKPVLWQLREGEEARFAWEYVRGNLEGARNFLFGVSPGQPNSLWLTLLGIAGVAWALYRLLRLVRAASAGHRAPLPPAGLVVALFGVIIAANLGLLMFYYWSRLDEPIAARFALPLYFALAVAAGCFVHAFDRPKLPAVRIGAIGLAAWVALFASRAYAHRFYTTHNMVMHELNWELEQVTSRRGPVLLITAKATLPFLLERIPAVNTSMARVRGPQIAWHMEHGTFREVLVSQVLRPTSAEGNATVDPDEALPPGFQLETLAVKRFGGRWIRISRVTEVEGDAGAESEGRLEVKPRHLGQGAE